MTVYPWREAPTGDYAVIGDPIAHSRSPAMHHAAYAAFGLEFTYRAIHVPRGEAAAALDRLRDLGYRGVNATVPHKSDALAWAQTADPVAIAVGGANVLTLDESHGSNSDVFGLSRALADAGFRGGRALVLGAGGSAAAAVFALADGICEVEVWSRGPGRARELRDGIADRLEELGALDPADAVRRVRTREEGGCALPLGEYDLILNATSASLRGERIPLDWSGARPGSLAYDLAYGVSEAPFLRDANAAGLVPLDGRGMLAWQGAGAFYEWGLTGSPERGPDAVYPIMRGAIR